MLGDSNGVRHEHAIELFRLLGGGVTGDLEGMPASQLAALAGTAHFVPPGLGLLDRAEWLLELIPPFLDAPMPESDRPSAGTLAGGQTARPGPPRGRRTAAGPPHGDTTRRPEVGYRLSGQD